MITRAHLVPIDKGALLKELFTRDGAGYYYYLFIFYLCFKGVLISRDTYEGAFLLFLIIIIILLLLLLLLLLFFLMLLPLLFLLLFIIVAVM